MNNTIPCPNNGKCGSKNHLPNSASYQECLRASNNTRTTTTSKTSVPVVAPKTPRLQELRQKLSDAKDVLEDPTELLSESHSSWDKLVGYAKHYDDNGVYSYGVGGGFRMEDREQWWEIENDFKSGSRFYFNVKMPDRNGGSFQSFPRQNNEITLSVGRDFSSRGYNTPGSVFSKSLIVTRPDDSQMRFDVEEKLLYDIGEDGYGKYYQLRVGTDDFDKDVDVLKKDGWSNEDIDEAVEYMTFLREWTEEK